MKRLLLLVCCLCLALGTAQASDLPYDGYATSPYGTAAPSPVGYDVQEFLNGKQMGAGSFNKPCDLFVGTDQTVYVADTGNKRIVVLDAELHFLREYTAAGNLAFESPKGVFADKQGFLYVADDVLGLVLKMDPKGALVRTYSRPVSDMYDEATPYMPQKVVADSAGRVYVLSQGVYQGLIRFNEDGSFLSFYGANHVQVTAKMALQKLMRVFMTREQWSGLEAFVPIEYSNIDIDEEDMVYASVGTLEKSTDAPMSIFKLNPLGVSYRKFGAGSLADALNDRDGYYTCLAKDTKEVFEFAESTKGIMLTCGGSGTQKGLFQDPVALGRVGEDVLVLDRENGCVTRFRLTPFGRMVHEAIAYSAQGRYQEAVELYKELLVADQNYTAAYTGLGKAYYEMEDYAQSMRYYKLGFNQQGYSDAFKEYSTEIIRKNMGYMIGGAAVVLILFKLWSLRRKRRGPQLRRGAEQRMAPYRHPFHCMVHAYAGFEGVKLQGTGSMSAAVVLVALLAVSSVVSFVLTGFAYNPNRIEKLNAPLLIFGSLGSFGLFYLASLAVSSLMGDCEGKPKELFIAESYALLPYILGTLITAVITNFLSLDVQAFITFFMGLCIAWSVVLLVVGMMQVNQLTVKKTLLYLLLVLIALVIVLVLIVLLYSLVQQFVVFLQTLYSEMMYRM